MRRYSFTDCSLSGAFHAFRRSLFCIFAHRSNSAFREPQSWSARFSMDWFRGGPRTAGTAHMGASSRRHHDGHDTGHEGFKIQIRCRICKDWRTRSALIVGRLRRRENACRPVVGSRFKSTGCCWSIADRNALLAVRCCLENIHRPDFLDWRACHVAAA